MTAARFEQLALALQEYGTALTNLAELGYTLTRSGAAALYASEQE